MGLVYIEFEIFFIYKVGLFFAVISKWISDMGQELKRPCIESISNTKYLNSAEKLLI